MQLSTLLASIFPLSDSFDCEILGLAQDSRLLQAGYLFLACRGKTFDGRNYIEEAIAKGAKAVLAEGEEGAPRLEWRNRVPLIHLPQLSSWVAELASKFYRDPGKGLQLVGVTGTNGKTSCSHFVAQALHFLDRPCGLIGTLGYGLPGALKETLMTTPDTVTLQRFLAEFQRQKLQAAAMEVSSHSLDQKRIEGLVFDVGIFTNLTQDHLDYHKNMAAYGAAKKRFFTDYPLRRAVINADDAFGRELIALLPCEKVLAYSCEGPFAGLPTIFVEHAQFTLSGIQARVSTPWGVGELFSPIVGEFNLSNLLAVLTTLGALGFPLSSALASLAQLKPVPGRMQILGGGKNPWVVVDYSHTPDSLEKALRALRKHCQGQLYCLMGCGGDRDKSKRPQMGAVAEQFADFVTLTSDNPRHEDPERIIAEIRLGLKKPEEAAIQPNRSQAIQDVIQSARAGDYVLIAGKGAETYQQIGDVRLPFDDVLQVEEVLTKIKTASLPT